MIGLRFFRHPATRPSPMRIFNDESRRKLSPLTSSGISRPFFETNTAIESYGIKQP